MAEGFYLHLIKAKILIVEILDKTRLARLKKAAVKIIAPGMIRADHPPRCAFALQQFMATMLAHIVEGAQVTVIAANGNYALSLNVGRGKASGLCQLFFMAQKLPGFVKDLMQL